MAEFDYPHSELLVSADWLAQHLHDPNIKIIDARSAKDYSEGHIPGAVLLPAGAFRSTSGVPDACTPEAFATTAGALGIQATNTVVCYDGTGGARTWWVFARFGHQHVRFLNGGFRQWQAGGYPTSTEALEPHPMMYELGTVQDHLACSLAQAAAYVQASDRNDILFWDVRSVGEYTGADPRSNPPARAGHIPRAVNLEWTELVDASSGLLKPADEMRRLLEAKGITPDKEIVSYCQGGGRAAHGVLVLKLLGYGRARNFDGSYGAYAASNAPIER
jgi:thiosulfate/3-mercaptopyruvate sulfurtransferase